MRLQFYDVGLTFDNDLHSSLKAMGQRDLGRGGQARPLLIQRMVERGELDDIAPLKRRVLRAIASSDDALEIDRDLLAICSV